MKRNISLLLLVCTLLLCLISCGNQNESGSSSNGNSSNGNSSTNTMNYDPNTKAELSVSDRQDLAEKELLAETFRSFTSQSYLNYYTMLAPFAVQMPRTIPMLPISSIPAPRLASTASVKNLKMHLTS